MRSLKLIPKSFINRSFSNTYKLQRLLIVNTIDNLYQYKYSIHITRRDFSTNSNHDNDKNVRKDDESISKETTTNAVAKYDHDEYDDYEEPKTTGQKIAFFTATIGRLLLFGLGGVCIFFTAKELFPGRMNPNSLFSEIFECIRYNEEVMVMTGEGMKAYGRDTGRNTEGRRNQIESYAYTAADNSNRIRIKFCVEGKRGKVLVWAEVSDRMAANEYVYIICQHTRTGKVYTVRDNRDQLEEEMMNNLEATSSSSLLNSLSLFKK